MEISKKELKEILKEQSDNLKRHVEVIMEKFQSEIKLISEQYGSITETLNSHTEMIGSIKETLDSHTEILNSHAEAIGSIKETLNSHTETLNSHTEMIGSIKEDVEITKTDVEFIKTSLKKTDAEEFSALERRVAVLESKNRTRTR